MNMVTKSDLKKFIALLQVGINEGKKKELSVYTSADMVDGTDVPKEYYVSLDFKFRCSPEAIQKLIDDDSIDNEIKDVINSINP